VRKNGDSGTIEQRHLLHATKSREIGRRRASADASKVDRLAVVSKIFVPSDAVRHLRRLVGPLVKELRMKKLLVTSLLAFAACGFAQDPQTAQPAQTTTAQQPAAGQQAGAQGQQQPQQKTIKDPAEYNAYMSAISTTDPAAKAQALEAFLQQYPNTVVKEETLEQLMAAYQAANNPAKMTDAANRLLQVNPNNIRALALLTYSDRSSNNFSQASSFAERGLQAAETMPRPAGMNDADYKKLQDGVRVIFNGAIGMNALQNKDYAAAQKAFLAAVSVPEDANNLQDVYPLATAYLQANPPDYQNGLFWSAKAVDLAQSQGNTAAMQQIDKFAQYYYKKFHGSTDGWDQYKQAVATAKTPQEAPQITPAPPPPTPCEFADTIMKQNPEVSQMAYGDWLFVLGSGNQADADKVWTFLNGKGIPVSSKDHPAKVISATPDELQLATTDDDIQENKADVTLKLAKPLPASKVPTPGSSLNGEWIGKATSYTPLPPPAPQGGANATPTQPQQPQPGCLPNTGGGVMLTLTEGEEKTATPAHRTPARRPTHRRPSSH
jgi:tetratricopeptide (TPR) repeat protein